MDSSPAPVINDPPNAGRNSAREEVRRWAVENGYRRKHVCKYAAIAGNLNILKKAVRTGHPMGVAVTEAAAWHGHFKALKWLRKQRCPWDEYTLMAADYGGHARIVDWAIENGCPTVSVYRTVWSRETS